MADATNTTTDSTNTTGAAPKDAATNDGNATTPPKDGAADTTALQTESAARKAAEKRAATAEAALQKLEDAGKTEAQRNADNASKAEQRATAAEARLAAALTRQAIIDAAIDAGTIDSDSVAVLALASGQVTVGDDGEVAGAKQAVAALAKSKPHLFRPAGAGNRDASSGGANFPLNDGDALTKAVLSAVNR